MGKRAKLCLVATAVLCGACADTTGPPRPASLASYRQDGRAPSVERHILRQGAAGRALETYRVELWVVRGRSATVQVDYQARGGRGDDGDDDGKARRDKFLIIDFPANTLLRYPDDTAFRWGDSVRVTVSIDATLLLVHLEPSGLVFNPLAPVRLTIWYGNAAQDFDDDGRVDENDLAIEQDWLGLWYQERPGMPWSPWTAEHFKAEKRFRTWLYHFSGYAVSW